jgi:hypothetical protein
MTPEEEILTWATLIHAICKVYPIIMERTDINNDAQEGINLLNSLY